MNAETISRRLTECGIPFPAELPGQISIYHEMLLDWNSRMDLTAVTDEAEMLDRHYTDSLIPLKYPSLIPPEGTLIDVGTGAGFPGLPLALACPGLRVTLMDAQQKRLTFLQAVIDRLGISSVTLLHARAEDAARRPNLREHFDIAVARAVAAVPVLVEYLLPFVRLGGRALCWKGPAITEELAQGAKAARILGGRVEELVLCSCPGRDWQHYLLPVRKEKTTPNIYPRKAGTPSKQPLGYTD